MDLERHSSTAQQEEGVKGSMSAERTGESCRQLATLSTLALHASHRIASSVSGLDNAAVLLPLNHLNPKIP